MTLEQDVEIVASILKDDYKVCSCWPIEANKDVIPADYIKPGLYGSRYAANIAVKGDIVYDRGRDRLMRVLAIVTRLDDDTGRNQMAVLVPLWRNMIQKWLIIHQTSLNDSIFHIFESDDEEEVMEHCQWTEMNNGSATAVQIEDIVRFLLRDCTPSLEEIC